MGKEKIAGALMLILALLVMVYYTWGLVLLKLIPSLGDWVHTTFGAGTILDQILAPDPMFLIILPVWLAAVLICVIAMWIGWTMLTTPAPEPLEDFDFDEESVSGEKKEEKKEEKTQ
ncbi:MAG: hypothetical protein HXY34_02525 [Candidatus Thorarchaeota archaeon]|nr:hypothetical protein [Candidatus Thorarchaeota archaeon]